MSTSRGPVSNFVRGAIDMAIDKELLDQLLAGRDPEKLFARDGLIDELKKALSERMLAAELDDHLESEAEAGGGNRRNGTSQKTMLTGSSKVTLNIPRDRSGTFDPKLIAKYQRRFPDFDTKIISMYARGMTPRAPRGALRDRSVAGPDLEGDGRRASRHAGGIVRKSKPYELQSLMRISYADYCLKKKTQKHKDTHA